MRPISYPLNKLLTTISREHAQKAKITDAEMEGFELSAAERTALADGDTVKLYELGANPYLIRRDGALRADHHQGAAAREVHEGGARSLRHGSPRLDRFAQLRRPDGQLRGP